MADLQEEASKGIVTRRVNWLKLALIVAGFAILGIIISVVLSMLLRLISLSLTLNG